MHPSEGVEKEYEVRLETEFSKDHLSRLLDGVMTEEGYAKAERVWMQNPYVLHIILKQGLKRQIRLMLYALGDEVERLTRTRIGGLLLKGLPRGGWKELTEHQVAHCFKKSGTNRRRNPRPHPPAEATKGMTTSPQDRSPRSATRSARRSAVFPRNAAPPPPLTFPGPAR